MSLMAKKATEVIQLAGLQTQAAAMGIGLGITKEGFLQEMADTWDALEKTVAEATGMALAIAANKKVQS